MECLVVDRGSRIYEEIVRLRYKIFFEDTNTSIDALFDKDEESGVHLVVWEGDVKGYCRLNFYDDGTSSVSQFLVNPTYRGKWTVWKLLYHKMLDLVTESGVVQLNASVRVKNVRAFSRFGFCPVGDVYPSAKTGIPHQNMEMKLIKK